MIVSSVQKACIDVRNSSKSHIYVADMFQNAKKRQASFQVSSLTYGNISSLSPDTLFASLAGLR
jgi:hypothetical protein